MYYGPTSHLLSSITTPCFDSHTARCSLDIPKQGLGSSELQTILQIVFGIIGAIAVLIVVISGFRMVISQGNPEQVRKARDAIMGAVIGLVIAVSAEILVTFVLNKI